MTAVNSSKTVIDLTAFENAMVKMPPTVTGTIYEAQTMKGHSGKDGSFSADAWFELMLSIEKRLKTRAVDILRQNPWLASRIIKSPNHKSHGKGIATKLKLKVGNMKSKMKNLNLVGEFAMEFPTEMAEVEAKKHVEKVVRIRTTNPVGGTISDSTTELEMKYSNSPSAKRVVIFDPFTENKYDHIVESVRPMVHSNTASVLGETRSLWDIILVPLTEGTSGKCKNKFILIHSLNSSIADPATFYKIYAMISSDQPVERLDPTRIDCIEEVKQPMLGGDPNFMRSQAVRSGIAKRLLQGERRANSNLDPKRLPNKATLWIVNREQIQAVKEAHKIKNTRADDEPSMPYVSTNDILTSWFLSQKNDAVIGCLKADLRGKHPLVPTDRAGNYETEIIYNTGIDTKTPSWIRASLARRDGRMKRYGDKDLPGIGGLSGKLGSAPGASIMTNWSALYKAVVLKQTGRRLIKPEVHFPILLQRKGIEDSIGWSSMVVFRYNEEKLGVLVVAPSSPTEGDGFPLDRPALLS